MPGRWDFGPCDLDSFRPILTLSSGPDLIAQMEEEPAAGICEIANSAAVIPIAEVVSGETAQREILQIGLVSEQVGRVGLSGRHEAGRIGFRARHRVGIVGKPLEPRQVSIHAGSPLGPPVVLAPCGGYGGHRPREPLVIADLVLDNSVARPLVRPAGFTPSVVGSDHLGADKLRAAIGHLPGLAAGAEA